MVVRVSFVMRFGNNKRSDLFPFRRNALQTNGNGVTLLDVLFGEPPTCPPERCACTCGRSSH